MSPFAVTRYPLLACLGGVIALSLAACGPSDSVAPTPTPTTAPTPTPTPEAAPRSVILPQDEGAHDAPIEWWYFNGHLSDDNGQQYSFHYVTFKLITPDDATPRLMQLSLADHWAGTYLTDERFSLAGLPESSSGEEDQGGTPGPGRFHFQVAGWQMRGDGRNYGLAFDTAGYSLDLKATSLKPAALHQGTGLVDMGRAGETYYYTRSRLDVLGTLSLNGTAREVTGTAWMDHQWGDFSTAVEVGWNWVSLQLDDGSELMISQVWDARDRQPIIDYGTFIPKVPEEAEETPPVQTVQHLTKPDITLVATGSWTSPTNGAVYPMGWELEVASIPLSLTLTPVHQEAEFANSRYIPVSYWEGAVSAVGEEGGESITGQGFVELVGYAPPKKDFTPDVPGP